ncbi:hypothetical protein V5799_019236 [Amblyomma americanum]|uniref:Uncharacterized protein n=1 Tax=Amblyomma americanum TaxID=6943 RepID=A0AAQ4EXH8_AMBAM
MKTWINLSVQNKGHVRDIDLFSGGLSETRLEGAQLGATFSCGVAKQFRSLKQGDRFYYENANQPGSFLEEQLETIKRTTMAAILCRNVEGLDGVTFNRNAFLLLTNVTDGVTCDDLPDIDLSKWREENAGDGNASNQDVRST